MLQKNFAFLFPFLLVFALPVSFVGAEDRKPNLLIITVDDMSADSLGVYGCALAETSPNIDAFARQSLRFNHAHVQVGNCMPGRNIMWSGLFSHRNGVEGFVQNKKPDYPVLCDLAKQAGYFAAIRGKVSHSTPYHPYDWDAVLDQSDRGKKYHVKDPKSYGESTRRGIELADESGKPFCLLINISDPHKPFYSMGKGDARFDDPYVPTRVFRDTEVPIPGFLFENNLIRQELALYYSSVRRADDAFREIMLALDHSGKSENTFVMFLSDHGMPLPFAKTQLYQHSTHTPLMIRWPGVTKPDSVDDRHLVSAIDFLPTLLEVMGHPHPKPQSLHGRSFAPLIRGETQSNRDHVILQYNENSGGSRHPMRGIQTKDFLYLYNPWSNGERRFTTATTSTVSYRQMVQQAGTNSAIAARLKLFDHRVLEELYQVSKDPDCLQNLIAHTEHQHEVKQLRQRLAEHLARIEDPVANLLVQINDHGKRHEFMAEQDSRSREIKRARQARRENASRRDADGTTQATRKMKDSIVMKVPDQVEKGTKCGIAIRYRLPPSLAVQKVHVTLKTASLDPNKKLNERIDRQVVEIEGNGEVKLEFDVPGNLASTAVRFAAFVGEDFESNLQYVQSNPIPVGQRNDSQ